ncbi:MAG: hypothetical protein GY749_08050 [Desulfobacteraceae bacterium]|nr:hypothetical protein [Desulfobacteraceae bacterium]
MICTMKKLAEETGYKPNTLRRLIREKRIKAEVMKFSGDRRKYYKIDEGEIKCKGGMKQVAGEWKCLADYRECLADYRECLCEQYEECLANAAFSNASFCCAGCKDKKTVHISTKMN